MISSYWHRFIIYLFILFLITQQCCSQIILNTDNHHFYEYIGTTANYAAAVASCKSKSHNLMTGYLVTITTMDEWQWLVTNFGTGINIWTSGTDLGSIGVWRYDQGPETGQPLYNLYFDKPYTFVGFAGIEPNLIANENYINAKGTSAAPAFNNITPTTLYTYICEYDNLPFISSTGTQGGPITIQYLNGYNINNLTVTFTSNSTPLDIVIYEPEDFTVKSTTSVEFNVQSGTGKYTVIISDGNKTSETIPWGYQLPFISTVYPGFNVNDIATIVGDNFGNDPSVISVTFSEDGSITCGSVIMILPNKAFSCVVSQTFTTQKVIPVYVNVNGLYYKSYKASLFYPENEILYSGFLSQQNFIGTMNDFAAKLKLDGYDGYLSVIDTLQLYNFLKFSLPSNSANDWRVWQSAYYNSTDTKYYHLTGPNANTETTVYRASGPSGSPTASDRFTLLMSSAALSVYTGTSNTAALTQFGGYSPTYITSNKINQVLTSGERILIKLKNFGITLSDYNISLNGTELLSSQFTIDYIAGGIYIDFTSDMIGVSGPYQIDIVIDGKTTSGGQSFIQATPTLTSITTVPTTGGTITLQGTSLYSNSLDLSIQLGSTQCENITYVVLHKEVTCDLPAGTGSPSPVSITVGSIQSSTIPGQFPLFSYEKPNVTELSTVPTTGGRITIGGSNFGTDPSVISVTIGGVSCTDIEILTDQTAIICNITSGQGIQTLIINVNSQIITSQVQFSYEIPVISTFTQNLNTLTIKGSNFGEIESGTIIKSGNTDITSLCEILSQTEIECTNIPTITGSITISNGGDYSEESVFALSPYIDNIEPSTCLKSNNTIEINGGYFELLNDGNGTAFVNFNSQQGNLTIISVQKLEFTLPIGTGLNKDLEVQFDDRISNTIKISYCPPSIQLPIIQNLNKITVVGTGFGNDENLVDISFGSNDTTIPPDTVQDTELSFTAPPDAMNSPIKITVDGQTSNIESYSLIPIITDSTKPFMNGSTFTISGEYFSLVDLNGEAIERDFYYTLDGSTMVKYQDGDCHYLSEVSPYLIECLQPEGSISFNLTVKDALTNETLVERVIEYQSPLIIKTTSIIYKKPGTLTISVLSFNPNDVNVLIQDSIECTDVVVLNSETIQCEYNSSFPPNKDGSPLLLTVQSSGMTGSNAVLQYIVEYDCYNNCSWPNGECLRRSGACKCTPEWTDTDCSLSLSDMIPLPPPSMNKDEMITQYPGLKLDFNISISHLREVDFNGTTIKTKRISDIKWIEKTDISDTEYYFKGIYEDDPVILEMKIQIFNELGGSVIFAEDEIPMQGNSMKYLITVSKWSFKSQLNSLQVIYSAKTKKTSIMNCESTNTTTIQPSEESMTWFKLSSGVVSLNARFSNKAIVDDRIYQINIQNLNQTTDELYNDYKLPKSSSESISDDEEEEDQYYYLLTALITPHFNDKVVLDPNFGALLKSESDTECSSSFAGWKIALIVVFGAVACAIPVAAVVYTRYQYQIKYKVSNLSLRLRNLQ